jgi:hypothetical protein
VPSIDWAASGEAVPRTAMSEHRPKVDWVVNWFVNWFVNWVVSWVVSWVAWGRGMPLSPGDVMRKSSR